MSPSSSIPPPSEAEQIEQLKKKLQWAELKIQVLEERLRLELIAKYGPASEKLSDAQLELLQWEPGVSNVEVQTESEREAERAWTDKRIRQSKYRVDDERITGLPRPPGSVL